MTIPKPFVNSPSCRYLIGIGKSTANDAHDDDDDELQRFSKGEEVPSWELEGSAMGREQWERKCDADVRLEAVYLLPNISPCSYRDRRPARP
jgi:hypothetical protein